MEQTQKVLEVKLLDYVQFTMDGITLKQEEIRSAMVTKLLAYILVNHNANLLPSSMAKELWHEDETISPLGALKNLIYRLRKILSEKWPDVEFIITAQGSYRWNQEVAVDIDAEHLEQYCTAANAAYSQNDKDAEAEYLSKAVEIYNGKFLRDFSDTFWVITSQQHYQDLFISASKRYLDLLREGAQQVNYKMMEEVSRKALHFDMLDEELHAGLLRAYIGEGRQKDAEDHYRRATDLLYDQMGIMPSKEMHSLHDEILHMQGLAVRDMDEIVAHLEELDERKGAFYCDYTTFRNIYNLESRRVKRLGLSCYLGVMTVLPDKDEYALQITQRMYNALIENLRAGDVVAKYNNNQFVVLLTNCNYENAKMVMNRIVEYHRNPEGKDARVSFRVKEIAVSGRKGSNA